MGDAIYLPGILPSAVPFSRLDPTIRCTADFHSPFLHAMVLTAPAFTSLLHSLGLIQGISKPTRGPFAAAPAPAQNKVAVSNGPSPNLNLGTNYQAHPPGNFSSTGTSAIKASTGCDAPPYDARDWGEQRFAPFDQAKANVYRYRQQQSVNLGSW